MADFETLLTLAVRNKGSKEALEAVLPEVKSQKALAAIDDSRYLSNMARCIFRAGFVWKVIDNKWPQFEEVFAAFNPLAVAHFSDEKLEELAQDTRIVRNATKIRSVRENAVFVLDMQREHGSMANLVAQWPENDIVGLWALLKKQGSRLGGNSGPMLLRLMGKDTFILTEDVKAALVHRGLIDKFSPNSRKDLDRVQAVFNGLHNECGRPYSHISRILSLTV